MIRRSPSEVYIRYLILHPKGYQNDEIKGILEQAHFDFLGNWYLDKLRKELRPPIPFRAFDRNHAPSNRFLYQERLHSIFFPDEHGKRACEILKSPRLKEFVEAMLTVMASNASIADQARRRYKFQCETITIDRYASFFWNMQILDSTEMRALLLMRSQNLLNHSDPEIRAQASVWKKASYKDARVVASDLPSSPLSTVAIMAHIGAMPTQLDMSYAIKEAVRLSQIRIVESLAKDGLNDSRKALDLSTAMRNLVEVEKELVHPDENITKEIAKIGVETDKTEVPTLQSLSKGAHTVEVAKMETNDGQQTLSADLDDGDDGDPDGLEPA